jgi:hypothetical protein
MDLLTPNQAAAKGFSPIELAARNWVEEVKEIETGRAAIPAKQLMQIRYEDLIHNPKDIWAKITTFLGLRHDPKWFDQVLRVRLYDGNKGWTTNFSNEEKLLVNRIQSDTLRSLGYEP